MVVAEGRANYPPSLPRLRAAIAGRAPYSCRKHDNLSLSTSNALRRGEGGPADGSGTNLAARQPSLYDGPSAMTWMTSTMEASLA
jgi:hypothetical protein